MGEINEPVTTSYNEAEKEVIEHFKKGVKLPTRCETTVRLSENVHFLCALTKFNNSHFNQLIAYNSNTPPEVLTKLAEDEDDWVRKNVISNTKTPVEVLQKLWTENKDVTEYYKDFAFNENTPSTILTVLSECGNETIKSMVACNLNTCPEVLRKLAVTNDEDEGLLGDLAQNPNTPPDVLVNIAQSTHWYLRRRVAENPSTSTEVLTTLAEDSDEIIRESVAENPNTPPEALTQLAEDEEKWVRMAIAGNPSTPPEVLSQLVENDTPKGEICVKIATNPNTPAHTLLKLAKEGDYDVKIFASEHINLHVYLQHRAEQDGICETRQQMPVEWLKEMYLTKNFVSKGNGKF